MYYNSTVKRADSEDNNFIWKFKAEGLETVVGSGEPGGDFG